MNPESKSTTSTEGGVRQQLTYPLDHVSQEIIRGIVGTQNESHGMEVFTADGTFTVPSGVRYIHVRGVGGGAGGGASDAGGGTVAESVVSGGGAAYCESVIDVSGVASVAVIVGQGGAGATSVGNGSNGGDTEFGSYFVAEGGFADGTPGTATGGDINIDGGYSKPSLDLARPGNTTQKDTLAGDGGPSAFGPGSFGLKNASGRDANFPGSGAAGGGSGAGTGLCTGGDGADGIIIITW